MLISREKKELSTWIFADVIYFLQVENPSLLTAVKSSKKKYDRIMFLIIKILAEVKTKPLLTTQIENLNSYT